MNCQASLTLKASVFIAIIGSYREGSFWVCSLSALVHGCLATLKIIIDHSLNREPLFIAKLHLVLPLKTGQFLSIKLCSFFKRNILVLHTHTHTQIDTDFT